MTDVGSLAIGSLLGLVGFLAIRRLWPLHLLDAMILGAVGAVLGGWFADKIFEQGEHVEWTTAAVGAFVAVAAGATINHGIGYPADPGT